MKVLLLDPYAGASGDMTLGCLLDLGADLSAVKEAIQSLGCRLQVSKVQKSHIQATMARIAADERYHSLGQAKSLLQNASLDPPALEKALQIVDILAAAEAKVHGISKEEARFHEIGALDALADIAGSCAALQTLEAERILSLPISAGGGFVQSAHGLLPVPGPAALEILRHCQMPWRGGPVNQELLTPTGAAIFACMVDQFLDFYPFIWAERVGYGAASRELPMPNALRGVIGQLKEDHSSLDRVVQLETNVDDATGEMLGNLIEVLIEAGALDALVLPATMKKGRPGSVVLAVAREHEAEKLSRIIMQETGSLGVRIFPSLHRYFAEREDMTLDVEIDGSFHQASLKVGRLEGFVFNIKPEFEDCRRIASETGLPLRMVAERIKEEGWKRLHSQL